MFSCFTVILGPYGLSGTLTGVSFRHSEPAVQKLLEEWRQFFPVEAKTPPTESLEPPMPAAVEVVVGEWSLWSPWLSLLHPLFSFCWLIILTLFSLCVWFVFLCILFLTSKWSWLGKEESNDVNMNNLIFFFVVWWRAGSTLLCFEFTVSTDTPTLNCCHVCVA